MMPIKKCALKKSVINFQIYTHFNAKYQKYQSTILCVLEGVGCWGIFLNISSGRLFELNGAADQRPKRMKMKVGNKTFLPFKVL